MFIKLTPDIKFAKCLHQEQTIDSREAKVCGGLVFGYIKKEDPHGKPYPL